MDKGQRPLEAEVAEGTVKGLRFDCRLLHIPTSLYMPASVTSHCKCRPGRELASFQLSERVI